MSPHKSPFHIVRHVCPLFVFVGLSGAATATADVLRYETQEWGPVEPLGRGASGRRLENSTAPVGLDRLVDSVEIEHAEDIAVQTFVENKRTTMKRRQFFVRVRLNPKGRDWAARQNLALAAQRKAIPSGHTVVAFVTLGGERISHRIESNRSGAEIRMVLDQKALTTLLRNVRKPSWKSSASKSLANRWLDGEQLDPKPEFD